MRELQDTDAVQADTEQGRQDATCAACNHDSGARTAGPRFSAGEDIDTEATALRVEQAIFTLRHGRDVAVYDGDRHVVVTAAEHATTLATAHEPQTGPHLLLSRERASVLGHVITSPALDIRMPQDTTLEQVRGLAGVVDPLLSYPGSYECQSDDSALSAAVLELARQAARIPALLIRDSQDDELDTSAISAADIQLYCEVRGLLLERAVCAEVPLAHAPKTEFIAYRERFGDAQHVAVVVGEPDLSSVVTVRIHSACFTGDLFSSLRCDCGEQLAGAVDHMVDNGGGVILYLDQEGRGIGLVNKLRAYRMQSAGHDTIDADRHLGFGADGRDFTPARTILADLGIDKIRLLTNNPAKISALDTDGIRVVERVPLSGSINPHNARYLETKRDLGGHMDSVVAGDRRGV
jgi:GTP cyclohydrolase II